MTHIQDARQRQQEVKEKVCAALQWTEEKYAYMQYNCGLYYLVLYLREHVESIRALEGSRLYWNWWKTQWALRDLQWLDVVSMWGEGYSQKLRVNDYYNLHDSTRLAHNIAPGRIVTYKVKKEALLWER